MGKIKVKGKAGAAKAYVTRSSAIKKLQCSLADFRRLCILKGIFPREPRSRKKANKGSSAPTSFYYAKDIAYLAHEPVLKKLREQKAFAKRLARAIGRSEWSSAKSLEDNKPVYRLDHIIKERYPTFIDALRDIDDALCLVSLFASLPSNPRLPPSLIENCARLSAEWQLYVMHSRTLRKSFLSIKGIYFQAEVMEQTITWLVPYQFTQSIPTDVDIRVMLTFLELYQTLLGFVFFKLYTDAGLVYPPPLDAKKDETAAGVGAYNLQEVRLQPTSTAINGTSKVESGESKSSQKNAKQVRQAIKSIASMAEPVATEGEELPTEVVDETAMVEEEFQLQPSSKQNEDGSALPNLQTLSSLPQPTTTSLFSSHTFFISRETSRPLIEFLVRSFGGRVGWSASSGSGSPFQEDDAAITHVIIDRPLMEIPDVDLSEEAKERRMRRKYVQPQWIVDCINAGKILLEEPYEQGKALPPHLSPFGEERGAYEPLVAGADGTAGAEDIELEGSEEEEEEEDKLEGEGDVDMLPIKATQKSLAMISGVDDPASQRAAELEAEAAGVDFGTFEKAAKKKAKKVKKAKADDTGDVAVTVAPPEEGVEQQMNKMMMSRKNRKLYERMKYGERKRDTEKMALLKKKESLNKAKRREANRL